MEQGSFGNTNVHDQSHLLLVLHQFVNGLLDHTLALGIQSRSGLVKQQHLRFTNQGSSNRNSLPLPSTELENLEGPLPDRTSWGRS